MNLKHTTLLAVMMFSGAMLAGAQTVTKPGATTKASATIQQINKTSRIVTFKTADGKEIPIYAGPEVKRFDELKVGDKVDFTYYESTVYSIRTPGSAPIGTKGGAVTSNPSAAVAGGTMARQTTSTVTVQAVDQNAGTITVTTERGDTVSRKVDQKSNLNGVKVGDKIDIVYTEALLVNVDRVN